MTKHVVIVGGGFAGVKAARELGRDRRFQVTLISDRDTFEYHAALYRSATGHSPLEVAVPLKQMCRDTNADVVIDEVTTIESKQQVITCKSGSSYHYDELILALGVVTSYFGIKGLPEYSYDIKTIEGAQQLKNHLHSELTSGHKPDLNYVVVGGGPSGIELAGEMVSYLTQLRKNHRINKPFHVDLVEAAPRILPNLPERFGRRIEKRLKQIGVTIYTSTAVNGETASQLQLPHGTIDTHTVIWTAGVTNNPLFAAHDRLFELGKGGRVTVEANLSAGDHIWVAGDSALTLKTGWAQTAVYDGAFIAKTLKSRVANAGEPTYSPPDPIGAIPVGPSWCGVNLHGRQIFGYPGWMVRRWADFHLYRQIMPFSLALKTWLNGTKRDESCRACR